MDNTFAQYQQEIETSLNHHIIGETIKNLKPLKLFVKEGLGEWLPLRHAGFTLITPTFEDEIENIKAYVRLGDLQQLIIRKLNPEIYIPAPISAFHQTVARLISGSEFDNQIQRASEGSFLNQLKEEFSRLPQFEKIRMKIKGVSVLPGGFIAALILTTNENEYQRLLSFRSLLYSNEILKNFGIESKRPFVGHITLAYIQTPLNQGDQNNLLETIRVINRQFFETPLSFEIARAEVRKFDNYLKFYRESDWPVYRFS